LISCKKAYSALDASALLSLITTFDSQQMMQILRGRSFSQEYLCDNFAGKYFLGSLTFVETTLVQKTFFLTTTVH
jgi:hypothetical protein